MLMRHLQPSTVTEGLDNKSEATAMVAMEPAKA